MIPRSTALKAQVESFFRVPTTPFISGIIDIAMANSITVAHTTSLDSLQLEQLVLKMYLQSYGLTSDNPLIVESLQDFIDQAEKGESHDQA